MNRIGLLIFHGSPAVLAALGQTQPAASTAFFHFREPHSATYRVEGPDPTGLAARSAPNWLSAWPENGSGHRVDFGRRVALKLKPGTDLRQILKGSVLKLSRNVAADFFVLEAPDASAAMSEAPRLAARPGVLVGCPVPRPAPNPRPG